MKKLFITVELEADAAMARLDNGVRVRYYRVYYGRQTKAEAASRAVQRLIETAFNERGTDAPEIP